MAALLASELSAPACPLCGAQMRRLTAWKGARTGKDFWGCTQYAESGCRGIINIEPTDEVAPSVAGGSAQAQFERQRDLHRRHVRAALPFVVGVTVLFMAMALALLSPFLQAWAILPAIFIAGAGAYALIRLPPEALMWEKGAQGERRTAEYLALLADEGFVVLHDRRIPGGRANIDQIAIGPSGVYVIETKNLSGAIDVRYDTLWVSGHDRQRYVDEAYREAIATQIALSEALNRLRITVTPVLCIHGSRTPLFDHDVEGVRLVSGKGLRKLAASAPRLLTDEQVQELAALADKRLRPMPQ